MGIVTFVILALALLVVLIIVIGTICTLLARRIVPTRYEWLDAMSYDKWKKAPEIIEDLLRMKKLQPPFGGFMEIIYSDLGLLEEEKLIERRQVPPKVPLRFPRTEFKLTSSGIRKKNEQRNVVGDTFPKGLRTL
jgi:hypothetical protein